MGTKNKVEQFNCKAMNYLVTLKIYTKNDIAGEVWHYHSEVYEDSSIPELLKQIARDNHHLKYVIIQITLIS